MALKVKKKTMAPTETLTTEYYDSQIEAERVNLKRVEDDYKRILKELEDSRNRLSLLTLERDSGFKLGDTVSYPVSSGRTKKMTTCIIECEGGQVYVRPVKSDGTLSTRHFYVYQGEYKDLKAVK